ncbi:uncharacterized protein EV420DRAFT_1149858 [Desarmillaria tabescens]|uniref:Uncharacterized protein n=1 Tax=Armillaria tabescens TaxID=1929756 RepID=A0AA39NCK2_ARMTA|nr:uncharacterized protein EV420DRAFT_1149858 [Desarmillaria tabescens]KAK0463013.1 hypothetical protein EV420DRAFT_1149858 [Desarmillaria tabescens]
MDLQEHRDVKTLVIAFDTLQVLGFVLTLALLAPALLSPNVKRTVTWFGMIVSGIVYCASYSILMFIGAQGDQEPSTGVCLFQACLVHATPVFCVSCVLSFVVELLASFLLTSLGKSPPRATPIILLVLSFILSLFVLLDTLMMGLKDPKHVRRNGSHLYCHLTTSTLVLVFCVLGVIISLATMIAEVVILIIIRKTMINLKRQPSSPSIELPTHLFVRLFSFSCAFCVVSSREYSTNRCGCDFWHPKRHLVLFLSTRAGS